MTAIVWLLPLSHEEFEEEAELAVKGDYFQTGEKIARKEREKTV